MKKKLLITICIAIMFGIGIIINNINLNKKEVNKDISNVNIIQEERILVQITGEVLKPGIYEMSPNDRINDLIKVSGGFTSNADTSNINLVEKISDGIVVSIGRKKTNTISNNYENLISINKSSLSELTTLTGIGESKAKNIITYREVNGGFNELEELLLVSGISYNIYNNLKELICL